jgi:hypothetical protein
MWLDKRKKVKDEIDRIESVFMSIHRDNLAEVNIYGLKAVRNLRKILRAGTYESPLEKKRKELNKSLESNLRD